MTLEKESILQGKIEAISGFSGAKERCPECGREVDDGFCAVHAEVEPENDFSMTVKVNGENLEVKEKHFKNLIGFEAHEIDALPRNEKMQLLKQKIEGVRVRATGGTFKNKFYPDEIDIIEE